VSRTARTPILVGIGTAAQREDDPRRALEPIDLMIQAVRAAGRDAGGGAPVLGAVERILVPKGRWSYGDPGRAIARAVGANKAVSVLSTVGVLQQSLIGEACHRIAEGEIDTVLVAGGDTGFRILRSRITGTKAPSADLAGEPDVVLAPHDELRHAAEIKAGLRMPVGLYAIIDSAFRAKRGRSVEEHARHLARLYARFTAIAATNPHAWTRTALEPDAIRLPSDRNPMQAFPYTKRHCSSWNVDQAAALLFCSEDKALAFGLGRSRFVYPLASTESNHMVPVVARAELDRCSGARIAGEAALSGAGIGVGDLDLVELYSCFPVAVEAYADELGIPLDRDLTVAGGMPFAGGPYNNYVLQATCRMAELLRDGVGQIGLVSSVSGIMTKQGFGLWSTKPPRGGFVYADVTHDVAAASPERDVAEEYSGPGHVAGYTVVHEGGPARGVIVADVERGRRAVAVTTDSDMLARMEAEDFIGRPVVISSSGFAVADARVRNSTPAVVCSSS
jgi:acetyl-CoA C-acetyltransferase